MFRHAKAMERHGIGCGGVGNSRLTGKILMDAADFGEFVDIKTEDMFFKFLITFRPGFNKGFVLQAFADDVIQEHIHHRDIGPRSQLQMISGVPGHFSPAGIDHNGGSLHRKLFEFGAGDRMGICGVGPDDHDKVRVFEVFNTVGCSAGTESPLHA